MPLPSVKTLAKHWPSAATKIRTILEHEAYGEATLEAISDAIDGYGVEYLTSTRLRPGYAYVNMGDPYKVTVILNLRKRHYYVGCWAPLAEQRKVK